MQTLINKIFALLILVALSACAPMTTNYVPTTLPDNSLETMASDIAPIIADNNPAKSTSFVLRRDNFGQTLAQHLGKLGYEVMFFNQEQQAPNAEEIRYTIDWISPSGLYLALTVNNSQRYTRTYTVKGDTVVPNKTKIIGVKDGG